MIDEKEWVRRMAQAIRDVPYVGHGEPPSAEDMAQAALDEVYDDIREEAFDQASGDE